MVNQGTDFKEIGKILIQLFILQRQVGYKNEKRKNK